jgi:hypothetical protein
MLDHYPHYSRINHAREWGKALFQYINILYSQCWAKLQVIRYSGTVRNLLLFFTVTTVVTVKFYFKVSLATLSEQLYKEIRCDGFKVTVVTFLSKQHYFVTSKIYQPTNQPTYSNQVYNHPELRKKV